MDKSAMYIAREKQFPKCTQCRYRKIPDEGGAHGSPFSLPSVAGKDNPFPVVQLLGRPLSLRGSGKGVAA